MEKFLRVGILSAVIMLMAGCQLKLPFNKASEKLVKVAQSHEIGANKEIVMGEFHDKSYKVYVSNKAKSHIIIYLVDKNTEKHTQTFRLNPKENATILAAKYEKVVFQNPSGEQINIDIGVNRKDVGFRSQPIKDYDSE